MKWIPLFSLLLIALVQASCTEPEIIPAEPNAIITGSDMRFCACCGGYLVTFSDNPEPYVGDFYQWDGKLDGSDFDQAFNFPVYVRIEYEIDSLRCSGSQGWLLISKLELTE